MSTAFKKEEKVASYVGYVSPQEGSGNRLTRLKMSYGFIKFAADITWNLGCSSFVDIQPKKLYFSALIPGNIFLT